MQTAAGTVRVRDTGGKGPVVVMTPDGPNVIEHHTAVIDGLARHARVVCFEMPGFGWSRPTLRYDHSLGHGARAVLSVMDALHLREATLFFSCANGFYAIAAAHAAPERIRQLLLCQTPGWSAMEGWIRRNVPLPLRVPVLGQAITRLTRRKVAHGWYGSAIPDKVQRAAFRSTADDALAHGACFCLAGVIQGLRGAVNDELSGVLQRTTMLWGGSDRSHRHTNAESLLELLPQAQITHFAERGHFPDLEQPARYVDIALATLNA